MIYINAIGVFQTVLFSWFIYKHSNDNLLNKLLALLLLLLGFILLGNTVVLAGTGLSIVNAIFFISQGASLFLAPVIYCYINLISGKKIAFLNPLFLLSFFVLLYVLFQGYSYLNFPEEVRQKYMSDLESETNFPEQIFLFHCYRLALQQLYLSILWLQVFKLKKVLKNVFSTRSRTRNDFAFKFVSFVWFLNLVFFVFILILPTCEIQFLLFPLKALMAFSVLLFFTLEQKALFDKRGYESYLADMELLNKATPILNVHEHPYLTGDKINEKLREGKLYLNPAITIFDLAKELNCNHRTLSAIINTQLNKSFLTLINEFRVEEAKKKLINNSKKLTMEGIGLESGFNSRASFYRVFKKLTRRTPSDFLSRD
jgi:AraC-like DNA-binding protein